MQPLQGLAPVGLAKPDAGSAADKVEQSFAKIMTDMVSQVNDQQQAADRAVQEVHAGGAKNLHEAMIALEEADISLRFLVQVRNKAMDAYQEIMRMQV
ncbi:MAG TPA: flagellar hook-basal body complex protein FliE [Desulfobulbus sp.]|nr:flagellar hook-basal body complex protein FliE [Desulfobulbus sp.]